MIALLLAYSLFLFLTFLGKAVLELMRFQFPIVRSWLLSPAIGLAITVLLVLNLNQAGLPVKSFASALALGLIFFILVVFWRRRPVFPYKQITPFFFLTLASLIYTCWPMFLYGFKWVGYMNPDMGTYCLGALRAINNGFYRPPIMSELSGTDYSQYFWFHYAVGMFRCGADIFLAWVASVAHLEPLRASMPLLAALNLSQIFTAASLILSRPTERRLALGSASLLAVSPFFIMGVMTQLAPQVGGLVLLLGLSTLLMRSNLGWTKWKTLLSNSALIAITSAALCIYYPEVIPFATLAAAGFHVYRWMRGKERINQLAIAACCATLLLLVFARQSVLTALGVIRFATKMGIKTGQVVEPTPFDTMLDPSVFASLFGISSYYGTRTDPWISIAIATGMLMLGISVLACIRLSLKEHPAAFMLLLMLGLGTQLLSTHSAFGVFKLAMYIQPVLFLGVAYVMTSKRLKYCFYLTPLIYFAVTLNASVQYVGASTSSDRYRSVTLPQLAEAEVLPAKLQPYPVLMNTPNMAGDFVAAAASVGFNTQWAGRDVFTVFSQMVLVDPALASLASRFGLTEDYASRAKSLRNALLARQERMRIFGQEAVLPKDSRESLVHLGRLAWDPWHSSNNRGRPRYRDDSYFIVEDIADVRNYLVLVSTDKGGPLSPGSPVSRWPVEDDFFDRQKGFYAIGRHLLFEVIQPSQNVHLRLSVSRSLMGAGRTVLPEGALIEGAEPEELGFIGSGSANVISRPIKLAERNGLYFFNINFQREGDLFPTAKTGLMRLFNLDIPYDQRRIVAFARDISLVSDEEYNSLNPPHLLQRFPKDLNNNDLEYSGIYEDGWVAESSYAVLKPLDRESLLLISLSIPTLGNQLASSIVSLLLDGVEVGRRSTTSGSATFEIPVHTGGKHRIELNFDRATPLPPPDDRPVSGQIRYMGFRSPSGSGSSK